MPSPDLSPTLDSYGISPALPSVGSPLRERAGAGGLGFSQTPGSYRSRWWEPEAPASSAAPLDLVVASGAPASAAPAALAPLASAAPARSSWGAFSMADFLPGLFGNVSDFASDLGRSALPFLSEQNRHSEALTRLSIEREALTRGARTPLYAQAGGGFTLPSFGAPVSLGSLGAYLPLVLLALALLFLLRAIR